MSTSHQTLIIRAAALVAGAGAATVLATIAYTTGHDSLGKGMIQGASAALLLIIIVWALRGRGGIAGRAFSGEADERDDRILTSALADAAVAMGVAAVSALIGSLFGLPGWGAAGIVLWAGLLTFLGSAVVRSRRY